MNSGRLAYNLQRTVDPTEEPISLAEAKRQCEVDDAETAFDSWFEGDADTNFGAIGAAREQVEYDANVVLMPQTWVQRMDAWPDGDWIDLRVHPVQSVTVSYEDLNDATQTWAASNYELQKGRFRSLLMKTDKDATFPDLSTSDPRPVSITIVAGYSNTTDQTTIIARRNKVPRTLRLAMLMLVSHWFVTKEAVQVGFGGTVTQIPHGYRDLVSSQRPMRYA